VWAVWKTRGLCGFSKRLVDAFCASTGAGVPSMFDSLEVKVLCPRSGGDEGLARRKGGGHAGLMTEQRLTEQLRLVFTAADEHNSPAAARGDAESVVVKREPERPAVISSLMEAVCERENLKKALHRVKANKGSPGVDGMTVEQLPDYLRAHWPQHQEELLRGTYTPLPVRRVEIPKPDGGVRKLGVPSALDRFVQQAVLQVLQPIFDPTFSDHSYGFRPGRSAHQAVAAAQGHLASAIDGLWTSTWRNSSTG